MALALFTKAVCVTLLVFDATHAMAYDELRSIEEKSYADHKISQVIMVVF